MLETIKATDRDIGKNAEIEYSIISGNVGDKFQISADQGMLTWAVEANAPKLNFLTRWVPKND